MQVAETSKTASEGEWLSVVRQGFNIGAYRASTDPGEPVALTWRGTVDPVNLQTFIFSTGRRDSKVTLFGYSDNNKYSIRIGRIGAKASSRYVQMTKHVRFIRIESYDADSEKGIAKPDVAAWAPVPIKGEGSKVDTVSDIGVLLSPKKFLAFKGRLASLVRKTSDAENISSEIVESALNELQLKLLRGWEEHEQINHGEEYDL
jgi:hypothetical protein